MKEETKAFFLRVLSDFLQGSPTAERAGVDWEEAFALAEEQSLDAVLYFQCRAWLPQEVKRRRIKPYIACAAQAFGRKDALRAILARTEKEKLPLLFMKGAILCDCYPIPALRSMGDIDCLVRGEDRERLDRILREELGYTRSVDNHAVWTYGKDRLFLEAHVHMFYEDLANDTDYRDYFDRAWEHAYRAPVLELGSEYVYVPEESFHFLYLMAHTAKHVTNRGSGFRPYLDMVLLTRRRAERLDWAWIAQELEKLRLLEFTRVCFALCERWFGVKMPLEGAVLDEGFYTAATAKSFKDGLFGLTNEENAGGRTAKELKRSELPCWLSTLRVAGERLFPPYEDLQLIPWYSFVDGRPWLTPAAWVYRWGYCLAHKRKKSADLLAEPFVKKKELAAREEWLRQWGL